MPLCKTKISVTNDLEMCLSMARSFGKYQGVNKQRPKINVK